MRRRRAGKGVEGSHARFPFRRRLRAAAYALSMVVAAAGLTVVELLLYPVVRVYDPTLAVFHRCAESCARLRACKTRAPTTTARPPAA